MMGQKNLAGVQRKRIGSAILAAIICTTGFTPAIGETVKSNVTSPHKYEIKVYYLKYAKAADQRVIKEGREIFVPGVATQLRGMMDIKALPSQSLPSDINEMAKQFAADGTNHAPRIESDAANNAVIVRDTPASMATYDDIIAAIDLDGVQYHYTADFYLKVIKAGKVGAVSQ